MGLIKDLFKKNEEQQQIDALKYLYNRLKIGKYRNMSMQDYFNKHYRANCYYYSTLILLCLKKTDRLVRGTIHLDGEIDFIYKSFHKVNVPNYDHGWVEFEYNNKWWVYDDHHKYPIKIEDWYELKTPYEIQKKFTQSELIEYIKQNFPNRVKEIKQGNKTIISTKALNISSYNIPFSWIEMEMKNGTIVKIEQDKDMKECLC